MPQIFLPQYFVCGNNPLEKIPLEKFSKAIIISDLSEYNCTLKKYLDYIRRKIYKSETILNRDVSKIYSFSSNCFYERNIDCIIAVGSPCVMDCGMLLSKENGTYFIAVPETLITGATDILNVKYSEYRKVPEAVVLDYNLINDALSCDIAYNGLASAVFAYEAVKDSSSGTDKRIMRYAMKGTEGVVENIIPAYRGDIKARRELLRCMYFCSFSFLNSVFDEFAPSAKAVNFFEQFGFSKLSIYAICFPNILDFEIKTEYSFLNSDFSEKIRKLQAILGIPRSTAGFLQDEERYLLKKEKAEVSHELLDLCYYGSIKRTSI